MVRSFVFVDVKDLTFSLDADGMYKSKYDLSYILYNENGAVINREDLKVTARLSRESYERARREGEVYDFDVPLKRGGAFQLRVAVRDAATRRIGTATQFVQAPDIANGQLALSGILLYAEAPDFTPEDWKEGVVLRQFPHGASLDFGYTIYNAALDRKTGRTNLLTQTVVFRDSQKIYSSDRVAVADRDQADLKRINAGARLQLGPALTAGEYVVQIVVEDRVAKRTTTQVTQFEVK